MGEDEVAGLVGAQGCASGCVTVRQAALEPGGIVAQPIGPVIQMYVGSAAAR